MMPLVMADAGEENIIRRVGGSPEMKKHTIGGNLIVKIKESRVAISKEMAAKIMV